MGTLAPERERAVESLVFDWVQDADVPGASVVLVDSDGELYAEGFGARDLETTAPATPETLYGMGSVTKLFTALAVADLADEGDLSLSDPVDDYVDHYVDAPGDPITLAQLLSHSSGMPATGTGLLDQSFGGMPAGVGDEQDRERFVRGATEMRVTDDERFFYYNTGYSILGRVVEAVDGRAYADYLREELFDPLGMDRATFSEDDFEADDDAMTGYGGGEGAPEPTPLPFEELIDPAGGLAASAREMGRFVRAAMTDGGRAVAPETIERCQQGRAVRQTYLDGTDEQYGYGWMRRPLAGDELVGHGGNIGVSTAYAGFLEDAGLGVALACNVEADPHPMEVAGAVLAVATGHEPTAEPAFALREKCEAVAGTYESYRGQMTATVDPAGGGVEVTLDMGWGEDELTAFPASLNPDDHTFYTVTGDGARREFEFDLDGDTADLFHARFRLQRR